MNSSPINKNCSPPLSPLINSLGANSLGGQSGFVGSSWQLFVARIKMFVKPLFDFLGRDFDLTDQEKRFLKTKEFTLMMKAEIGRNDVVIRGGIKNKL